MAVSLDSPLSDGLGYRLIKLGEIAFDRAAQALEGAGLRPRHFNVLSTVAADPSLSQKELSAVLGIDPNVMVGVIDDLEREGLASRRRSAADRRKHVVVITDNGHRVIKEGSAAIAAAEEDFFKALNDEERRALLDIVSSLLQVPLPTAPQS